MPSDGARKRPTQTTSIPLQAELLVRYGGDGKMHALDMAERSLTFREFS